MQQLSIVGPGTLVYINGLLYGRCISFSWDSSTPVTEELGVDTNQPFELVNGPTHISGDMQIQRTIGDGGSEGVGISVQFQDILLEKYFTLQLVELTSQTTIFQSLQNKSTHQRWGVQAKGLMQGNISFTGISWSNEASQ